MIEVKQLTKKYGDRTAVDNISFSVNRGEILGFLGQNGAGKSTTMKILTCFMPATSGTASVEGFDVFENPFEVKKKIGYLPENPPLYPELLVREYLSFVAELRGIARGKRKAKVEQAIEKCFLGDVRDRLIGNLSKGYRQRVGIAQAIIHEPDVLILDEPTIGLDPKQISEARNLIKSLGRERTVIFSSHILSEVAATCDRLIIIDKGKIVAQESIGAIGAMKGITKTELVVQRMSEKVAASLKKLQGVRNVELSSNGMNRIIVESDQNDALMAEISKTVVGENVGLVRMSPVQLALEDYYLGLIGGRRSDV